MKRLTSEGETPIPPHLLGWIAERLEHLNAPHDDILQARVTSTEHQPWRRCRHEARVELTLAAETVAVLHVAETADDAVYAALKAAEHRLRDFRSVERI